MRHYVMRYYVIRYYVMLTSIRLPLYPSAATHPARPVNVGIGTMLGPYELPSPLGAGGIDVCPILRNK
jgi:hypothetical protein